MRLALLYHQFVARGGLEGYLMEFVRRLRSRDIQLDLVTSHLDDTARSLGARIHVIPPPRGFSRWMLQRFASRSAKLAPTLGADAVLGFGRTFCQDIHRAGGGCHALYSRMLPVHKRLSLKNRWELKLERQLYTGGETKHFVVNSAQVGLELRTEYAVPMEQITVIHTGVDTSHFCPADSAGQRAALRREISPSAQDRPVLLYVAMEHRRKGLDTLLRALVRVPGPELWIAGQPLSGECQRLAAAPELAGRIRELGVRRGDLAKVFQAADLFVHPTRYDACANSVLQSMACELPGLISSADGARDFIREGENGWLLRNPEDVEELAEGIQAALRSDLPSMGRQARETMLPLTWETHVDQWLSLIAQVKNLGCGG